MVSINDTNVCIVQNTTRLLPGVFPEIVTPEDGDFVRCDPSLRAILGTCSQLNEEAASYFFANNKFIVSRIDTIKTEDIFSTHTYEFHDSTGLKLMSTAADFIDQLGSQARFLKELEIDIDTLCPSTCRSLFSSPWKTNKRTGVKMFLDVTALVLLLLHRKLPIKISFVNSRDSQEKVLSAHRFMTNLGPPSTWECNINHLNSFMRHLD